MAAWEPPIMYSTPSASRVSTRYRSSSACVTQESPGDLALDLLRSPLRMPICNVCGEPVSGQLPRLVPETQPFHARHAPQGFSDGGIDSLDSFGHRCHRFWMIAEDDWARN